MFQNRSWKSEKFQPELHWELMEGCVKALKAQLQPEDFERYFSILYKFTSGVILRDTLNNELASVITNQPSLQKASETLVYKLTFCCNMGDSSFEEYDDGEVSIEDRILPHPASINARLLLHCLKNEYPCPEGDLGLLINRTIRNSLYDIIEMALRTKKTYKICENGFLKQFIDINGKTPTLLEPRDFFDSLPFYHNSDSIDLIPPQLETSEAVTCFFDKMRRLSKFSKPVEND